MIHDCRIGPLELLQEDDSSSDFYNLALKNVRSSSTDPYRSKMTELMKFPASSTLPGFI